MLRDTLLSRLRELHTEFSKGKADLESLETRQRNLKETLLRISGAIQVLEELLEQENSGGKESLDNQTADAPEKELPATADE